MNIKQVKKEAEKKAEKKAEKQTKSTFVPRTVVTILSGTRG